MNSLVGPPGFPKGIRLYIENLGVKIGNSGVSVNKMLIDSAVAVLSEHFINLNKISIFLLICIN